MTVYGPDRVTSFSPSPSNHAAMRRRIFESLTAFLSLLALTYLGFLLAWFLADVVDSVVFAPLAGAHIVHWQLSAFELSARHSALPSSAGDNFFLRFASEMVQFVFLLAVLSALPRLRSPTLRLCFYATSLWLALWWLFSGVLLFANGSGHLRGFSYWFPFLARHLFGLHWLGGFAIAALSIVVASLMIRRIFRELSGVPSKWHLQASFFLALSAALVLVGFTTERGIAAQSFARTAIVGVAIFVFVLALISSRARALAAYDPSPRSPRFATPALAFAICLALWQAPAMHLWLEARYQSAHFDFRYEKDRFSAREVRALAEHQEQILAAEAARLGASKNKLKIRIILTRSFDSLRQFGRRPSPYIVSGTTIRAVLAGYVGDLDPAADATALLNARWGAPGSLQMQQWIARWVADSWRGAPLGARAAQLHRELGPETLASLLDDVPAPELSPLLGEPLGAEWIASVNHRFGLSAVHKLYSAKLNDANRLAQISQLLGLSSNDAQNEWTKWSAWIVSRFPSDPPAPIAAIPHFFFRGMSFEDSLGPGEDYASSSSADQLRALHRMGVNSISLIPYGFSTDGEAGLVRYTTTGENDVQVSEAAWLAHQLGMKVMLKPQLWVRGGKFTGEIHFRSPGSYAAWMRSYGDFILHYALLAEQNHVDLLCIGNELGGVTRNTEAWRSLIARIRRVYSGPLTYASNWNGEADRIQFWDALDYIGINNYYPLAQQPFDSAGPLVFRARALAVKLRLLSLQWHRPILFTEAGYPSIRTAAVAPWVENGRGQVDVAAQAAAYEATLRAFLGGSPTEPPWFRGIFWWKWPSSGSGGGPRDASYTPLGKPAAAIIQSWFSRLAKSSAAQVPPTSVKSPSPIPGKQ